VAYEAIKEKKKNRYNQKPWQDIKTSPVYKNY
jgi:hypothetical protein